ncbi:gas vesicle protein GvpO [Promicromonospora sp. NPDC057138]|uniref:gas vesicle protein GvpO n=1 Tax=Promicromonospora sp. NPDC057138 TaxID=3346031 RepID=UPI0036332A68
MNQEPADAPASEDRPRRRHRDPHARPAHRPAQRARPREADVERQDEADVERQEERQDEGQEEGDVESQDEGRTPEPPTKPDTIDARAAVRKALEEFTVLAQDTVEGVVGVERDDDTWQVTLEVLEDEHIPSTSDIMAEYHVRLAADGGLLGFHRGRRYVRGRVGS